jgi:hypothetical protein
VVMADGIFCAFYRGADGITFVGTYQSKTAAMARLRLVRAGR